MGQGRVPLISPPVSAGLSKPEGGGRGTLGTALGQEIPIEGGIYECRRMHIGYIALYILDFYGTRRTVMTGRDSFLSNGWYVGIVRFRKGAEEP